MFYKTFSFIAVGLLAITLFGGCYAPTVDSTAIITSKDYKSKRVHAESMPTGQFICATYFLVAKNIDSLYLLDIQIPEGLFVENDAVNFIRVPTDKTMMSYVAKSKYQGGEITEMFAVVAETLRDGEFKVLIELNGKKELHTIQVRRS